MYERARKYLEDADARLERAPDWVVPHDTTAAARAYWTDDRKARWDTIDFLARLIANHTAATSDAVDRCARLAAKADAAGDHRAYAKACAARIAMAHAVWSEAYGRYMLRNGGQEFQPTVKRLKQYR